MNDFRDDLTRMGFTTYAVPASREVAETWVARMHRQDRQRRNRRIRTAGIFAAASIAAVALLIQPQSNAAHANTPAPLTFEFIDPGHLADDPGRDARTTLLDLATTASTHPVEIRHDATQRVDHIAWFAALEDTHALLESRTVASELSPDGTLVTTDRLGPVINTAGQLVPASQDRPDLPETETSAPNTIDPTLMGTLELSAANALNALAQARGCEHDDTETDQAVCVFQAISDTATTHVWTSRALSNTWQALATMEPVRLLGHTDDRLGRTGTAIGITDTEHGPYRHILIIDPDTGRILGTETILIGDNPSLQLPVPSVTEFTTITSTTYTTG